MVNVMAEASFGFEPLSSVLVVCELDRQSLPEGKAEDDTLLRYTVTVDSITRTDDTTSGFCHLSVLRELNEQPVQKFTAAYIFAFRDQGDNPDVVIDRVVESTVWPRFRDLFAMVGSQAELEFPTLPLKPDHITRASRDRVSSSNRSP
jgi:hypothetical protein